MTVENFDWDKSKRSEPLQTQVAYQLARIADCLLVIKWIFIAGILVRIAGVAQQYATFFGWKGTN
jgi:hypothetical protein